MCLICKKEFSSETILSFVEFVQFKQRLIDYMKSDGEQSEFANHLLSESIPKSSIVYNDKNAVKESEDAIGMFRDCAHLLFEKYIKIGAEFEVNISACLRCHYMALDVKQWEMETSEFLNVFDCLVKEMYDFMRHSFCRYERS